MLLILYIIHSLTEITENATVNRIQYGIEYDDADNTWFIFYTAVQKLRISIIFLFKEIGTFEQECTKLMKDMYIIFNLKNPEKKKISFHKNIMQKLFLTLQEMFLEHQIGMISDDFRVTLTIAVIAAEKSALPS